VAVLTARAYVVAGAWAGVEAAEVAGVGVPALVMLPVAGLTSNETGAGINGSGRTLSTSFSDRKSRSFKLRMFTPVATSSRTVGMPSRTVTRIGSEASWNSSSRKGA
jgi:hypothetical protein